MEAELKTLLEADEATYLSIIKVNAYLDGIAYPTLSETELDAIDIISRAADRYNSRQEWLRDNSTGWEEYVDPSKGDWIGSPYGVGAIPLVVVAIAAVVGLVAGAGIVYSLTTASVEAAEDRITSSAAWQELCATNPTKCAELEQIISAQLKKVKNRGKWEGSSTFLLVGLGLAGLILIKRT